MEHLRVGGSVESFHSRRHRGKRGHVQLPHTHHHHHRVNESAVFFFLYLEPPTHAHAHTNIHGHLGDFLSLDSHQEL